MPGRSARNPLRNSWQHFVNPSLADGNAGERLNVYLILNCKGDTCLPKH